MARIRRLRPLIVALSIAGAVTASASGCAVVPAYVAPARVVVAPRPVVVAPAPAVVVAPAPVVWGVTVPVASPLGVTVKLVEAAFKTPDVGPESMY